MLVFWGISAGAGLIKRLLGNEFLGSVQIVHVRFNAQQTRKVVIEAPHFRVTLHILLKRLLLLSI
jgi:hypothetical protein